MTEEICNRATNFQTLQESLPWFFLVFVAVVMPRKSLKKPVTRSLGKFCRNKVGLLELLEAAAMATKTCKLQASWRIMCAR